MDLHEFDNVKAEKAKAFRSYRLHQMFKWDFRALFGLIVFVQSTTWVPIAFKFTEHFFRDLVSILNCHHFYVFILFNTIIFLVYAFSTFNPTKDNNKKVKTILDLYGEFNFNSTYGGKVSSVKKSPASENAFIDKHMVCSVNAVSSPPFNNSNQKPVGKSKDSVSGNLKVFEKKGLVTKCCRRTQSECYKRSKSENLRRELQRSNSNTDIELKDSKAEERIGVDGMSDEEFNRRIEAFIATQKLIQREEYKEERKTVWYAY